MVFEKRQFPVWEAATTSGMGHSAHRFTGLRVMVVEWHVVTGMMLANMAESLSHEVVGYTARPETALDLARTAWLDVALLELDFGESIYPVAEILVARNIPFIFSAERIHPPLRPQYETRPILLWPFDAPALGAMIDHACEVACAPRQDVIRKLKA
jgi:hypothetical protein